MAQLSCYSALQNILLYTDTDLRSKDVSPSVARKKADNVPNSPSPMKRYSFRVPKPASEIEIFKLRNNNMKIEDVQLMQIPSEILRQKCIEVDYSENLKLFADKMLSIMIANNGIGLAANQANIPWRMFVMKTEKMKKPKTFINPVILYECVPYKDTEGCLSCPDARKEITRSRYILIEYINYEGKKVKEHLRDLEARCAQHEIDHLNGILIVDKT